MIKNTLNRCKQVAVFFIGISEMMKSNILNEVLEACISTAKADPIKLVERDGKIFTTRGQLHCMLLLPSGSGKTTGLMKFPGKMNKDYCEMTEYRLPGIVGTISKDGEFLAGAIQQAAGKPLIIDEFHNLPESGMKAMLKLLEGEIYSRALGFHAKRPSTNRKKYCYSHVKDGSMWVSSRFSCICSGIFARKTRINDHAFLSRFMPIKLNLEINDAYDMSCGKQLFDLKSNPYVEQPLFVDYLKFVRVHKEIVENLPPKLHNFLSQNIAYLRRNIVDFSRIFSYHSRGNSVVDDWEKYTPYIPFFLYNYAASTLTLTEFEILESARTEKKQIEIAMSLGITEAYVSNTIKKLRGLGLV